LHSSCARTDDCRLWESEVMKKMKNNTSGYKGVSWNSHAKAWAARITVRGRRVFLGSFDDPVEAAKAYNEAALEYHGEFAVLNKIPKNKAA
jgi:hypothetical protein